MSLCWLLAAVLVTPLLRPWLRRAAWTVAVAVILAVGVALVWCDDHWTSDVIASLALVALIVWLCVRLTPWLAVRLAASGGALRRAVRSGR